jgi:hypothetical protein
MTRYCIRAITALLLIVSASRAGAQAVGSWEIGSQFMLSPSGSAPNSVFGGQAAGVNQSAIALRASADLLRIGPIMLRYSAQLLPMIRLDGVEQYTTISDPSSRTYVLNGRGPSYGIGFVPLGLDLSATLAPRVRVQIGGGVGMTRFSRNVPVAGSRQRNFSAEWDGLIAIGAGRDRWVQLGMRWKHISNGMTAWENPGIDNRMLFAGLSWRVRAPR